MTSPTTPPRGLGLTAIADLLERLAGELRARASNLDTGLDDLGDASKCASDDDAEHYVNALLTPLRLLRAQPDADARDPAGPSTLLSARDVARACAVTERTVRRWRSEGRLPPAIKISGVIRWTRRDIEELLARRGGAA